jgi:AcrR family transcriptional regulator
MIASTRERILVATLACVDADGLAATSIEDIARAASVGRATIYRHFPGGREQVLTETITW